MIWDRQRGVLSGTYSPVDSLYKLRFGYNGEPEAMIAGIFSHSLSVGEVIKRVMRLQEAGRLRAFAENPNDILNRKYPQYMMVLVPHVSGGKT